jgi:hypothetical protein
MGLLAGASQLDLATYLFPSQVAFQLIFLLVLGRTIAAVDGVEASARRHGSAGRGSGDGSSPGQFPDGHPS